MFKCCIQFEICDGKCCKDNEEMDQSVHYGISHKLEILLVEDNVISQRITQRFLENLNILSIATTIMESNIFQNLKNLIL